MKKELIREKIQAVLVLFSQSLFLAGITIFAVIPTACKLNGETPSEIQGDHETPVINDVVVVDENTVEIDFSEGVNVNNAVVEEAGEKSEKNQIVSEEKTGETDDSKTATVDEPKDIGAGNESENQNSEGTQEDLSKEGEKNLIAEETGEKSNDEKEAEISYNEDNSKVTIKLPEETETGKEYVISGQVEDKNGNTLSFSVPFTGYNGNTPLLVMTEIQTESLSQNKEEKTDGTYRNEFVEFLALTKGNLSGLELVSAYDGEDRKYLFPSVEVKAGEVFVVHLRNRGNGCVSEEGDDLTLAKGLYTSDTVRDLWAESESTALGNDTDIILVRRTSDKKVYDGVMFVKEDLTEWKTSFVDFAEEISKAGIYDGATVDFATVSTGMTASKTLSRKNALELMTKALEEKIDSYPIKADKNSWEVTACTCGRIVESE